MTIIIEGIPDYGDCELLVRIRGSEGRVLIGTADHANVVCHDGISQQPQSFDMDSAPWRRSTVFRGRGWLDFLSEVAELAADKAVRLLCDRSEDEA